MCVGLGKTSQSERSSCFELTQTAQSGHAIPNSARGAKTLARLSRYGDLHRRRLADPAKLPYPRTMGYLTTICIATLATAPAFPQDTLSTTLAGQSESLGWAIAELGDLDGDGITEVGVGAPAHRPNAPNGLTIGRVLVLRGASLLSGTPTPLYDILGPTMLQGCAGSPGSSFGGSVAGGMDINADGTPDFVASASLMGIVIPFDGATGTPMLPYSASDPNSVSGPCSRRHGSQVRLLDANGDMYADLLVTQAAESTVFHSRYLVYNGEWLQDPSSGAQKVLYNEQSSILRDLMGQDVAILGDIDGDQRDDFALSTVSIPNSPFPNGSVVVVSGGTGALIRRFGPTSGGRAYGVDVATVPDRNGDGLSDLAVMHLRWPSGTNSQGRVEIVSGSWLATGTGARTIEFLSLAGVPHQTNFGTALSSTDVNDDGVADILASYQGPSSLAWTVFSGRTGEQMWDRPTDQAPDAIYRSSSAFVDLGGAKVALLGMPGTPNGALGTAGEVAVVRAHDGAGVRETLGIGCPCGGDDPEAGCPNTSGEGARLAVESGSVSLASQGLTLTATNLPPFSFGILFGGVPAAPVPTDGGLVGVSQAIRGSVYQSTLAGTTTIAGDLLGQFTTASSSTPGTAAPMVGVPFALQLWYRSIGCAGTTNFTNSYVIVPRP